MLNRNPKPDFKVEIDIVLPSGETEKLKAECRYKKTSEYRALFKAADGEKLDDATILAQLYKSWDASEFPCTPAGIAELIEEYPSAPPALFNAYREALFEGRRKN